MKTESDQRLFTEATQGYRTAWANAQANSFATGAPAQRIRHLWSTPYARFEKLGAFIPRFVLAAKGHLVVQGQDDLLQFSSDGAPRALSNANGLSPVVLGADVIAGVDRYDALFYEKYAGGFTVQGHRVPQIRDNARVASLYPVGDDVIAGVQFSGFPEVPNDPPTWSLTRFHLGAAGWQWIVTDTGWMTTTLVTGDGSRVVLVLREEIHMYDAATGNELAAFEPSVVNISCASLDPFGGLLLVGEPDTDDPPSVQLLHMNLDGQSGWALPLPSAPVQPPVCGPDGRVYVAGNGLLRVFLRGEPVWQDPLPGSDMVFLTAGTDSSVVAVSAGELTVYNADGSRRFSVRSADFEDSFVTPAAIDDSGRVLVAGKQALHCFK